MPREDSVEDRGTRRLRGTLLLGAGVATLTVVLSSAWMVMRALTAISRPPPDLNARAVEIIRQTREDVGGRDEPDRWPDLLAVTNDVVTVGQRLAVNAAFGTRTPEFSPRSDYKRGGHRLTPAEVDRIVRRSLAARELLESEGVFKRLWALSEAKRLDSSSVALPGSGGGTAAHLSPCRRSAMLLRMDTLASAEEGDLERALRSFEATLAIARALSQQPAMLDQLTAAAIYPLALSAATDVAATIALTEDQAKAWIAAIDRQSLSTPGMLGAARLDRLEQESALAAYYTPDGTLIVSKAEADLRNGGHIATFFTGEDTSRGKASRVLASPAGNAVGDFYPNWDKSLQALDRYFGVVETALLHDKADPRRVGVDDAAALKRLHDEVAVTIVTMPAGVYNFADSTRSKREATKLVLSIAAYETRHGEPLRFSPSSRRTFSPSFRVTR